MGSTRTSRGQVTAHPCEKRVAAAVMYIWMAGVGGVYVWLGQGKGWGGNKEESVLRTGRLGMVRVVLIIRKVIIIISVIMKYK
jgi:hypothetical protein